jgi:hypothetical protein
MKTEENCKNLLRYPIMSHTELEKGADQLGSCTSSSSSSSSSKNSEGFPDGV